VHATSGPSAKVCVVGASGYTGAELLRLLALHPKVDIVSATSRQFAGEKVVDIFPHLFKVLPHSTVFEDYQPKAIAEKAEVVFFCLPHGVSHQVVAELLHINPKLKVIDLSADFRFNSRRLYEETYGTKHPAPALLELSAYGLPELYRDKVSNTNLVANPGCYPTGALLALYPAKVKGLIDPSCPVVVDSKSGVSGAGRKADIRFSFCEVNESVRAYSVEGHRHTPEISEKLGLTVRFTPHLVPMSRGILTTAYFKTKADREELRRVYAEFYAGEPFVEVVKEPPATSQVAGTNLCHIYITADERAGLGIAISAIDNLGKGASGQAVQNMNILLGLPETTGLLELTGRWV